LGVFVNVLTQYFPATTISYQSGVNHIILMEFADEETAYLNDDDLTQKLDGNIPEMIAAEKTGIFQFRQAMGVILERMRPAEITLLKKEAATSNWNELIEQLAVNLSAAEQGIIKPENHRLRSEVISALIAKYLAEEGDPTMLRTYLSGDNQKNQA
jgi:hypothetical protein